MSAGASAGGAGGDGGDGKGASRWASARTKTKGMCVRRLQRRARASPARRRTAVRIPLLTLQPCLHFRSYMLYLSGCTLLPCLKRCRTALSRLLSWGRTSPARSSTSSAAQRGPPGSARCTFGCSPRGSRVSSRGCHLTSPLRAVCALQGCCAADARRCTKLVPADPPGGHDLPQ